MKRTRKITKAEETIPLVKCKTVHGTFITVLGGAIPLINVELSKLLPTLPLSVARWLGFAIAISGGLYTLYQRANGKHLPVSGIFSSKE